MEHGDKTDEKSEKIQNAVVQSDAVKKQKGEMKPKTGFGNIKIKLLLILVVVAIFAGAYIVFTGNVALGQTVKAGDNIEVNYTGTFTNGTVFDSTSLHGKPFNFTVGAGQVIPGFDQGVLGMAVGQTRTITIPSNEAYGPVNPALIIPVPISAFAGQKVKVGESFGENVSGHVVYGVVTSVNATNATLDFNPPLAGKTLIFKITVLSIQK